MKKNKNKLATLMGVTALGTGVAVAAVAQACASEPTTDRSVAFTNELNGLDQYNRMTFSPDGFQTEVISLINNGISSSVPNSELNSLTFAALQSQNVIVDSTTNELSINIDISGETNSSLLVTGTITIAARFVNENFSIDTATSDVSNLQVSNTAVISQIVSALNATNNYSRTNIYSGLSEEFIAQTNVVIGNNLEGDVLDSLQFTPIQNTNVSTTGEGFTNFQADFSVSGTTVNIPSGSSEISRDVFGTIRVAIANQSDVLSVTGVSQLEIINPQNSAFIRDAINVFSNYTINPSNLPTGLAGSILQEINNNLATDPSSSIQSMQFAQINNAAIRFANNEYTVSTGAVTGLTTTDDVISGQINTSFTISGETLVAGTVTGLGVNEGNVEDRIVTSINGLQDYRANSQVSGVTAEFLTAINNNIRTESADNSLFVTSLTFSPITTEDLSENSNVYTVTIAMTGTADDGQAISGNAVATISYDPVTSTLSVASGGVTGLTLSDLPNESVIVNAINEISSYIVGQQIGRLAQNYLVSINNNLSDVSTGNTVRELNFTEITTQDISESGDIFTASVAMTGTASTGEIIGGTAVTTIDYTSGSFTIATDGTTGLSLSGSTFVAQIISDVNELRNYNSSDINNLGLLAEEMLSAMTAHINISEPNATITSIFFASISASNITATSSGYEVRIALAPVVNTLSNQDSFSGEMRVSIGFDGASLSINPETGVSGIVPVDSREIEIHAIVQRMSFSTILPTSPSAVFLINQLATALSVPVEDVNSLAAGGLLGTSVQRTDAGGAGDTPTYTITLTEVTGTYDLNTVQTSFGAINGENVTITGVTFASNVIITGTWMNIGATS